MDGNIYLTGFMGAGKSSAGRVMARNLGRAFVELDDLVERRMGMTIARAFERLGEDAFRRAECEEIASLAKRGRLVVSTGGGVVINPENRKAMRASGKIVFLKTGLETCTQRVKGMGELERPLWKDMAKLEALYNERVPAYADHDYSVDTEGKTTGQVAENVLSSLIPELSFDASLEGRKAPVVSTCSGPEALKALSGTGRMVLLCDHNLERLHLKRYRDALEPALVLSVAPGKDPRALPRQSGSMRSSWKSAWAETMCWWPLAGA